jgi:integrase
MRELRQSLGTKDKAEARRRLPGVLQSWQTTFDEHRAHLAAQGAVSLSPVAPELERQLLRQLYEDVLQADQRDRQARKSTDENLERLREVTSWFDLPEDTLSRLTTAIICGNGVDLAEELSKFRETSSDRGTWDDLFTVVMDVYFAENAAEISTLANDGVIEDLRTAIARGDITSLRDLADSMLRRAGCSIPTTSPAFLSFAHKVQRVLLEAWERRSERDRGDYRGLPRDPLLIEQPGSATTILETPVRQGEGAGRSLDDYFLAYERENRHGLKAHSLAQARQTIQLFTSYLGNAKNVSSITRAKVAEWTDRLREFPTRAAQISAFRGLSFQEIVDANRDQDRPALSVKTIRRMVSELSGLFSWMENRGYIAANPARGQMPRLNKASPRTRRPFRHNELAQFFGSPIYSGDENAAMKAVGKSVVRDPNYWMPALALLTGARMGELAQLHVSDVASVGEIWFLNITDLHAETGEPIPGKSLKTRSSRRVLPIHEALVRGGFLDFVRAHGVGDARLFPDLVRNHRGEFGNYSRDFGRYMSRIGLADDTLTFHSFRHTFMDALRRGGVRKYERELLAGHARHGMNDQYGEEVDGTLEERAAWIARLNFADFDPASIFK